MSGLIIRYYVIERRMTRASLNRIMNVEKGKCHVLVGQSRGFMAGEGSMAMGG